MGADLYVKKINPNWGSNCQGYFRDCYNEYGLFSFLRANTQPKEWSWWQFSYKKEWFNKKSEMTIRGAKAFKKQLLEAKEEISKKEKLYLDEVKAKDYCPLNKKNKEEYIIWLNRLINFLDLAIEQKSTIIWSV